MTMARKKTSRKPIWERKNPKRKHRYPNMVDNARASRK